MAIPISERFPFMADVSERPKTPLAQRRAAVDMFLGAGKFLLFQYEGAEEQNDADPRAGVVTLHLHDAKAGELVIVDAVVDRPRTPEGRVQDASIALIGLANNAIVEYHMYTSHDEGALIRFDAQGKGTSEPGMWVAPDEAEGLRTHFEQKVDNALYMPVNAVHAFQLQGVKL